MKLSSVRLGFNKLKSKDGIKDYLDDFKGLDHEEMVAFGFNNNLKYVMAEIITKYSESDKAQFSINYLFDRLKETGSKAFILVHNHPSGVCVPTEIDVETTKEIIKESEKKGIVFIEHYTWTNGLLWPIKSISIDKNIYLKGKDTRN